MSRNHQDLSGPEMEQLDHIQTNSAHVTLVNKILAHERFIVFLT